MTHAFFQILVTTRVLTHHAPREGSERRNPILELDAMLVLCPD